MTKLFLSAALVVASAAMAQRYEGNRNGYRTVSAREVVQNSARTHEILSNQAYDLSPSQLERVNEKLREIREIVRGGNGGDSSNPIPVPVPQPPPPQYNQRVLVRGTVENQEFSFEVEDLMGLHQQCVAFVQSKGLTIADDAQVSVNFGPIQTLHKQTDYWRGANNICAQIEQQAKAGGVNVPRTNQWILIGNIESHEFTFIGYNKIEINRQCEEFIARNGLTIVDDIEVSTNFSASLVLHKQTDYWRNNLEICSQVMKSMP